MRTFARLLALFLVLVGAERAQAQERDRGTRQRDPQSAYEPRSEPGAGQEYLKKFVGDWDVEKTFIPRSGQPVRATGRCQQTMIHDGKFLKSEFVFGRDGQKQTGTGIIGYDTSTKLFTSTWVDNRSTRTSLRRSREPFDGKQIVLYGVQLEGAAAPPRSRTVSHLEDDGRKLIHQQFAIDRSGNERLVMQLVMTRRGEEKPGR